MLVDVFDDQQQRYGTRHPQVDLRVAGAVWVYQALCTTLRRHGCKAVHPKASMPHTTDSTHGKRYAPTLLLDQPRPAQVNQVWGSNIPCLPLANGNWVYCCAFQDVCSK